MEILSIRDFGVFAIKRHKVLFVADISLLDAIEAVNEFLASTDTEFSIDMNQVGLDGSRGYE